ARGVAVGAARHEAAGEGAPLRGGEEAERAPGVTPGAPRPLLRVEDLEGEAGAAEIVADGEPRLPSPDHHHPRAPGVGPGHACAPTWRSMRGVSCAARSPTFTTNL